MAEPGAEVAGPTADVTGRLLLALQMGTMLASLALSIDHAMFNAQHPSELVALPYVYTFLSVAPLVNWTISAVCGAAWVGELWCGLPHNEALAAWSKVNMCASVNLSLSFAALSGTELGLSVIMMYSAMKMQAMLGLNVVSAALALPYVREL
jgi:hypothetical protein